MGRLDSFTIVVLINALEKTLKSQACKFNSKSPGGGPGFEILPSH